VFTIRFSAAEAAFKKQFSDGLLESLEALASGDKGRMLTLVHEHIRACRERGSTADEGCVALNVGPNSVAPRIYDLIKNGAVVTFCDANGNRVRRKTRQGCYARVVVAAEFAPTQQVSADRDLFHRGRNPGLAPSESSSEDSRTEAKSLFVDLAPERHRDDG
jgi:hypothetical protein